MSEQTLESPRIVSPPPARDAGIAPAASAPGADSDVFAAARRIHDAVSRMRAHGIDLAACEQIEALIALILSVPSLGDPKDRRAGKLAGVLQLLGRRLETMLEGCAPAPATDAEATASDPSADSPVEIDATANATDVTFARQSGAAAPEPALLAPAESSAIAGEQPAAAPTAMATATTAAAAPARAIDLPVPRLAPGDPLAALSAMSEEERIALFS